MKLLTVSIAAYHVEDYLRETLDSFLIPEVTDQLEVLIVNDGSGEGVNEIAREYQTNYPDVFRLIDKWRSWFDGKPRNRRGSRQIF